MNIKVRMGKISEFTYANLILAKNKELVKKYLEPNSYLIKLDDNWICFVNVDDLKIDGAVSERYLALSEQTPVLVFYNAEDHGCGYKILHNKEIISFFDLDYEFGYNTGLNMSQEMFGEDEGMEMWYGIRDFPRQEDRDKIRKLVEEKEIEYYKNIALYSNLSNFKLFEFSDTVIISLNELFTQENFINRTWSVKKFMEIIGIEKCCWLSWNYVKGHEENYSIIAET